MANKHKDDTSEGNNPEYSSLNGAAFAVPERLLRSSTMVIILAVVLTLMLISFLYLAYRHLETARMNALKADATTATLLASFIADHEKAVTGLLQSYASRPLLIQAFKNKDAVKARPHLRDLEKNPEIDLVFATDTKGILWINLPPFPESIGKSFAYRDWYKNVIEKWQPYISPVFKLTIGDKSLAVASAVPVFDEQGKPIGILATSYRLDFLAKIIAPVPLSENTKVDVIDREGKIFYSNYRDYKSKVTSYELSPSTGKALGEKTKQLTTGDHKSFWNRQYLSIASIDIMGSEVIVERGIRDILHAESGQLVIIASVTSLLFFVVSFFLIYVRHVFLLKKAEELLLAENRLQESEIRYRSLFENMTGGFAYCRMLLENGKPADFLYLEVNAAFARLTGLRDVKGRKMSDLLPGIQETDRDLLETYRRVALEGKPERIETYVKALNMWFSISLYSPRKEYFIAVFDVITERRQAEERLRESEDKFKYIFDNSVVSKAITLPDGRISANNALSTMLGYSREELNRLRWQDITHPDDVAPTRKAIDPLLSGKAEALRLIKRYLHKNGAVVWADVSASLRRDKDGNPLYFMTTIIDITERKKAEEEIFRLNAELEKRVALRTEELSAKTAELERINKVFVDRELRMRELKERIAELERKDYSDK